MKYIIIIILAAICSCVCAVDMKEEYPPYYACMTEPQSWMYGSLKETEKRFDIYKSIGVDMLRVELAWGVAEPAEGQWNIDKVLNYMKLAKKYGFKIKLIMGVAMAPPQWFFAKYPESMQEDELGRHSNFSLSYSFPELKKTVDEKTNKLIDLLKEGGVWDSVVYVIPTFGPAGEPIYPHPWTMGGESVYGPVKFWGYEVSAQKDFAKKMKTKYKSIEKANKIWNTDFSNWADVRILLPGEKPGAYWNDYLIWYRDRKRDFVKWEISNIIKNAGDKITLVYVPGTAYNQDQWNEAVATGVGSEPIKIMSDSMVLMEEALRQGAWLQYTGCENESEVARLRRYLDDNGKKDAVMWGENAGYFNCAKDPINLANIVIRNRLYGLDYTHAHFAFILDGIESIPNIENLDLLLDPNVRVKPNPEIMADLKTAITMIKNYNGQVARSKNN